MNISEQLIADIEALLNEDFQQAQHNVESTDPDHKAMLSHLKKHATASAHPFIKKITRYKLHDETGEHSFSHSKIEGEHSSITSSFGSLQHLRHKATGVSPYADA